MSGNHAPIPWTQYQLGTTIHGADGFYVGITQGTNAKGDAALIVAAVNSYASSQAEIERLRKALETIVDADTRPMYRNLETEIGRAHV